MAAYLEAVQQRCPDLQVSMRGYEALAFVARRREAACMMAARAKIAEDQKRMPTIWCYAAQQVLAPPGLSDALIEKR
ncbi:MAG: hypothetical protein JSS20_10330 [Proteobacteria bacterium]|nr:hypothetical protein [Pseudomonadota bacterium]